MRDPHAHHSGNVKIDISPGRGSIAIDEYNIGQFCTSMKLMFDAQNRRPVLLLDLFPSAVTVTGDGTSIELNSDFKEFMLSLGWTPPE